VPPRRRCHLPARSRPALRGRVLVGLALAAGLAAASVLPALAGPGPGAATGATATPGEVGVGAVTGVSAGRGARGGPVTAGRVPPLWPPLRGPLVRGFEAPAGPYAAGHRGLDLGAPPGTPVGAPAAGRVVFAGPVAGVGWASVEVAPGVVATVGPLAPVTAARGGLVGARGPVGRLAAGHGGALHLGLRVDGVYVDPLPYLLGRGPPRLAPLPTPGPPG
jgi:murein DD-endopeptidase MepM/ murein hydrolase activator NlpD